MTDPGKVWLVAMGILAGASAARARAAAPDVSFSEPDQTLLIRTDRYEVRWRDGCMVGLKTLLPVPVELTAGGPPADPARFPNGLGSFAGQPAEVVYAQHHPWGAVSAPFPAQHPPGEETRLERAEIPGGVRLTYRGLAGDPGASLVQELTVDPATGDLVIRQTGESPDPGVFGISFSLLNLRPDIELLVPYFGGQRWGPDKDAGQTVSIGWSQFWNAGFVVGQIPAAGDADRTWSNGGTPGTFMVWAEDPDLRPKFFRRYVDAGAQALGFESCGEAPYDASRRHEAFAWRFNTYAGNWIEPAERYKRWLSDTFGLVPRARRSSGWVDDIALIWPTSPGDPSLKTLADAIDPRRVLLMDFGMLEGFNRRIPEYRPADPDYARKIAAAKALGYRAGCYTSLALVDQETHPTLMEEYGLEYFSTELIAPKASPKDWLVYVHPGSVRWRAFYAGRMRELHEGIGLDFTYQDVTGCSLGSAGLVEGKNWNQAIHAGEDAIRAAVPGMALGGEYWTEINAAREDFGLATFSAWGGVDGPHWKQISAVDRPHPILSYVLSEYCLHWPHQVMLRDTERFHRDQNVNEVTGALPTWDTSADDRSGEARLVLERAELFAQGFRPHFPTGPGAWPAGTASYLRSPDGRVVRYARRGQSTLCYEQDQTGRERLRYGRLTGVDHAALGEPVTIDGWVAYGDRGPIGLDPDRWYCVFPAEEAGVPEAPRSPLQITALPEGAIIRGSRVTEDYCLVQTGGAGTGEVRFRSDREPLSVTAGPTRQEGGVERVRVDGPTDLLFIYSPPQPVTPDGRLPLDRWRPQVVANGQVLRPGALSHPEGIEFTIQGQARHGFRVVPPLGGAGSELSIDGLVSLPDDPRVAVRFSTGLFPDGIGDGMDWVVRVNGREVWRRHRESSDAGWRDEMVSLEEYAGKDVVLSFAVDSGPSGFNTSCDDGLWGDPRVVVGE